MTLQNRGYRGAIRILPTPERAIHGELAMIVSDVFDRTQEAIRSGDQRAIRRELAGYESLLAICRPWLDDPDPLASSQARRLIEIWEEDAQRLRDALTLRLVPSIEPQGLRKPVGPLRAP